jgi:hypothetical protein
MPTRPGTKPTTAPPPQVTAAPSSLSSSSKKNGKIDETKILKTARIDLEQVEISLEKSRALLEKLEHPRTEEISSNEALHQNGLQAQQQGRDLHASLRKLNERTRQLLSDVVQPHATISPSDPHAEYHQQPNPILSYPYQADPAYSYTFATQKQDSLKSELHPMGGAAYYPSPIYNPSLSSIHPMMVNQQMGMGMVGGLGLGGMPQGPMSSSLQQTPTKGSSYSPNQ